jgi:hypothetical protein
MPRTVQARLDEDSERDIAVLRNEGRTDSEAIRVALREAAELRRRRSTLQVEAQAASSDADDLAEARLVRKELDELSVMWTKPE